jgi:agmatinase
MYTLPLTFARRDISLSEAEYAVLGIPFDSSQSYRTGSRFAPLAIREASRDLEDYDIEEDFDLMDLKICDLGDVEVSFGNFEETQKRAVETIGGILKAQAVPLCLGGEHTITYFSAKTAKKDSLFVIYDAHLDYRDDYLGNRFSHASISRRLSELVGPENLIVIGVRSASKQELLDGKKAGLRYISSKDFSKNKKKSFKMIDDLTRGRKVYLSLDMDVFDPSELRGVCNPEPGGLFYRDILESLSFLKNCDLIGLDLTELSPAYDAFSPILAAKLLFKTLTISKI